MTTWLPSIYQEVLKLRLKQALNYGLIATSLVQACGLLIDRLAQKLWFRAAFGGEVLVETMIVLAYATESKAKILEEVLL